MTKNVPYRKLHYLENMLTGEQVRVFFPKSKSRWVNVQYCGNAVYVVNYYEVHEDGLATLEGEGRTPWKPEPIKSEVKKAAADLAIRWIRSRL